MPGHDRRKLAVRRPPSPVDPVESPGDAMSAGQAHGDHSERELPHGVRRVTAVINFVAVTLVSLALISDLVLVLLNVALRDLANHSVVWVPEVSQVAIGVMTFVGGALAYHKNMHIAVYAFVDRFSVATGQKIRAFAECIVLAISVALAWFALSLVHSDWGSVTPLLGFPVGLVDLPILVGLILFAYYSVLRLAAYPWPTLRASGLTFVVLAVVTAATKSSWEHAFSTHAVPCVLLLFVVLLIIAVPISVTLSVLPVVYIWATGFAGIETVPRQMGDGINSFLLLAVPFFVFAGFIMAYGGLSERIADISGLLIGKLPGGPLQAIVVSMFVFSGMSGSKNADVVAVGLSMKEMADRAGYEPAETGAVLGASAAMGETIPPSIAMLILGSIASVPIATLLIAGILPAAVLAAMLMILIGIRYRHRPRPPRNYGGAVDIAALIAKSLPAVALPVILAAGIIGGIGTPTEISSFAVVYGLALGMFVYRRLGLRTIAKTLRESAELTGFIMYIVGTAAAFAFTLTIMQLPQDVTKLVSGNLHNDKIPFLLASCLILIVLGWVLEGVPALLVAVPLLYPVADQMGIWNVQYGIVMLIAMGIGTFTPPLGIGTYVVCSVTGTTQGALARKIWPLLLTLTAGLIAVALFPDVTKALPSLLHMSE